MNQPPQGNYQPRPMPQPGYPQPPGQYPAYPPQFPAGAPYPVRTGPSKGVGLLKVLLGLCLSLSFAGALVAIGHEGLVAGAILGVLMGLGLRWIVTGGANLAGKNIPVLPSLAFIVVGGVLGAVGGPASSAAYWQSYEKSKWDEMVSYNTGYVSLWQWDAEYFDMIPPKFQRDEAPGMRKFVEVKSSIQNSNLVEVRAHVYDIQVNHKDEPHYAAALDLAAGELKRKYDEVLAKLAKPGGDTAGAGEFPVDEDLRKAFTEVLTDLARAPTADVHVVFKNSSDFAPPDGDEYGLRAEAEYVKKTLKLPVTDPPYVIPQGAAFSPAYDKARRASFMSVSSEAFRQVFDANLLSLTALEDGVSREGKFVLEVSAHTWREPSYYHYTSPQLDGSKVLKGFAFSIQVNWELKLFGRTGKLMYETTLTSGPVDNLTMQPKPSDPEWAIYSILMDSAYYNYTRIFVGSFGIAPPEPKREFAYNNYGVTGE